jgi:hypothetical protein
MLGIGLAHGKSSVSISRILVRELWPGGINHGGFPGGGSSGASVLNRGAAPFYERCETGVCVHVRVLEVVTGRDHHQGDDISYVEDSEWLEYFLLAGTILGLHGREGEWLREDS